VTLRPDLAVIAGRITPDTRVLDVGCGDGALLASLRDAKRIDARGMGIDAALVPECVARGHSGVQGDAERDLADYPDGAFDYAVLGQTLQTAMRPDLLLGELLRVGRTAFVSFPNFAHWRTRAALLWGGKMPVTRALPVSWFETRNIHHVTVADFEELARTMNIAIRGRWFFTGGEPVSGPGANWHAELALFELSKSFAIRAAQCREMTGGYTFPDKILSPWANNRSLVATPVTMRDPVAILRCMEPGSRSRRQTTYHKVTI